MTRDDALGIIAKARAAGEHPCLRDADLRDADLRDADLRDADLGDASLRDANLYGANLRGADLSGVDLSGANLGDIFGAQVLAYTDAGYVVLAVEYPGEWRIFAGCRGPWTIDEAIAHWGDPDYHTPRSGSRVCAALEWLRTQPVPDVLRGEG